jgi:glutamate-5-semialdehyde dehydrogenase
MRTFETLDRLTPGMPIVFAGNRVARVSAELAGSFAPGDALLVVQDTGELLRVPKDVQVLVAGCVARAVAAFSAL